MHWSTPKSSTAEERVYKVGITGTGAADPVKRFGQGVTVTRTGVGVVKFTFASNPGTFKGWGADVGADAPAAVKNYSWTRGAYDTAGGVFSISVSLWTGAGAAVDLAAAQYLDLEFRFSELANQLG
jgi:hypothetical protein